MYVYINHRFYDHFKSIRCAVQYANIHFVDNLEPLQFIGSYGSAVVSMLAETVAVSSNPPENG